jgi:hypothetical protein
MKLKENHGRTKSLTKLTPMVVENITLEHSSNLLNNYGKQHHV